MIRRFIGPIQPVGPREFSGIAATSDMQDDGYALDMEGANLERFANCKGPLIDNHLATNILGVITSISPAATNLPFTARFSSAGVSTLADQRCRELKDGVANFFSIAFVIDEWEPYDPRRPAAGRRATRWTLLEISLANVPVDAKAVVTARHRHKPLTVSQRRDLDRRREAAARLAFIGRQYEAALLAPNREQRQAEAADLAGPRDRKARQADLRALRDATG